MKKTGISVNRLMGMIITLIIVGTLLPLGLNYILAFTSTNSTVQTLITSVLSMMVILSVVLGFIPRGED